MSLYLLTVVRTCLRDSLRYLFTVVKGRLLASTSNTVVMASCSVTLTCMTDTTKVKWSVSPFDQPGVVNDITNASCALTWSYQQHRVNTTQRGQCDLVIANTSSVDAGMYTCTDGSLTSVPAQLTVLSECFNWLIVSYIRSQFESEFEAIDLHQCWLVTSTN